MYMLFSVFLSPHFHYFWILFLVDCKLSTSTWISIFVVVLLSSVFRQRRPGSVNAGETRSITIPWIGKYMFHRRGALHRRLSRLAAHEAKRPVEAFLKQLLVPHVEALAIAVESKGAEPAPCILLRADDMLRLGRSYPALPPHLLFCQLWRWADLRTVEELKPLPTCKNSDADFVCCNPYHWCRLCKPDSPPPPYTRHSQELPKIEENTTISRPVSDYLSGSTDSPRSWSKIAYWELSNRVGRLLPVSQSSINVFADLPHGDGLCLQTLAKTSTTDNISILHTRAKIGQGFTMFKEDTVVWIYNRSEYPIFVNSPTLDPPNTENLTVYKVLPGYAIKIFDYKKSLYNQRVQDSSLLKDGPIDNFSVRLSFVKGWGSAKYSRRFITCCPCWIEVMFNR